ncbi:hypothetical protein [Chitinophaga sp. Cy-1792]|uniref:hypothetical protein n=1 Tax=Chitinophaga sp. Cy-1792 TaxID=2608339 RepID=UPI00141EB9AF|nr:hypothetical protein [Chitinophaga sp. Cy-1792]NIG51875.1 hypothetical protein [Chitinophaga sp. Cy-1792]
MRVVVFFVCLCLLLFRGDVRLFAETQRNGICNTHAPFTDRTQHVIKASPAQDFVLMNDESPNEDKAYMISETIEENDNSECFSVKFKLLFKYFLIAYYQTSPSGLSNLHKYFKAPSSDIGQESCKYILQGVLRI